MIDKKYLVVVTVTSETEQDADHDLNAWIRTKNLEPPYGAQINSSTLIFERVKEIE